MLSPIAGVSAEENENHKTEKLSDDMEFIFEDASSKEDGEIIIDEEEIAERFGEDSIDTISAFIKMGYGKKLSEKDLKNVPKPADAPNINNNSGIQPLSWTSCIKGKVLDATGIGFLTGGMNTLIQKEEWTKLGKKIIKIAGKNAIRGGIVGFAASMSWYSVTCIGE